MQTVSTPRRRLSGLSALVALFALAPPALPQDRFEPGVRWTHAATDRALWLPDAVAFAGHENLAWAGASGPAPRLMLLDANRDEDTLPRFEVSAVQTSFGPLRVAAGARADAVYALAQYPSPDVLHRRVEITRHDPVAVGSASPDGVWTHVVADSTNGAAEIATDESGDLVVAAASLAPAFGVRVEWISGEDGTTLDTVVVPASSLEALRLSADGTTTAVVAGGVLHVFDRGTSIYERDTGVASPALALSGDGTQLVYGAGPQLQVFTHDAGRFRLAKSLSGPPGHVVARAELSRDGSTLAVGWWDPSTGVDARLDVLDARGYAVRHAIERRGAPGGMQNLPSAIAVSPAGERIAFGSWGDGAALAEVLLVDRAAAAPLAELDLPGSVRTLAIDSTGTRLLIGHQQGHANQLSTGGAFLLFDTGENALQLGSAPELGGTLTLLARQPGAQAGFFLVGIPSTVPSRLPGIDGASWLAPGAYRVYGRRTDPSGTLALALGLPAAAGLLGRRLAVQAVFRAGAGARFVETRRDLALMAP